jgi:CHAD domain-containing protein
MAKANDIEGLTAEVPFGEAAARTIAVRAAELFEHSDGVLDTSDIERVHDMRVATRRLRAMLEVYESCFPAAELKVVLRDVKRLADALGARRDPDVQLAALAELSEHVDPDDRPGLDAFAARLRDEQLEGNEILADALRQAQDDELPTRLEHLVVAARDRVAA